MDKSTMDAYQIHIKGFTHESFSDLNYLMEGDEEKIELQRSLIRSFFDIYLKDIEGDFSQKISEHDELSIEKM